MVSYTDFEKLSYIIDHGLQRFIVKNREFKIATTATATATSLNKRFNEQNNGSARAL